MFVCTRQTLLLHGPNDPETAPHTCVCVCFFVDIGYFADPEPMSRKKVIVSCDIPLDNSHHVAPALSLTAYERRQARGVCDVLGCGGGGGGN